MKTAKVLLLFLTSVMVLVASIGAVFAYEAHTIGVTVTVLKPEAPICLVIIDEDTIDNDISTIMDWAYTHGVTPDELVNDDHPTEVGNPWLLWNLNFPGDLVLLPGGEVKDEGWFALPTTWPIEYEDDRGPPRNSQGQLYGSYQEFVTDFIAGTVPQEYLDKIMGVIPLRNNDIRAMIRHTCIAVVYDSDISINYQPIYGNLQGARYGLFAFTVEGVDVDLGTQLPGSIPESLSDTSLLDLRLEVLPPLDTTGATPRVPIDPLMEQVPDSVQIIETVVAGGEVTVRATSDRQDDPTRPVLNVSVGDPLALETLPATEMVFHGALGIYEITVPGSPGDTVTVSSNMGGSYTVVLTP